MNSVEIYLTELGYAVVTWIADYNPSTQCFQLFAYAMAAAPEMCYSERIFPTRTDNTDELLITQSDRVCETPFHGHGITGKCQVNAISDTKLDLESRYFVESSAPDENLFGTQSDISIRKVIQYVSSKLPYRIHHYISQLEYDILGFLLDDVDDTVFWCPYLWRLWRVSCISLPTRRAPNGLKHASRVPTSYRNSIRWFVFSS